MRKGCLVPFSLACLVLWATSGFTASIISPKKENVEIVTDVIDTSTGKIRGRRFLVMDRLVDQYLGIPYARPPIDDLRFLLPQPVFWWNDVHEAVKFPNQCMQYVERVNEKWWLEKHISSISEDCLYLNIWIPSKDPRFIELKPILIWIHGGGFSAGSTDVPVYNGKVLAAAGNLMVVTLNYRLGIFGFLNGGTKDVPGNMGLFDQLLAIKWIKNNAQEFGGNPNLITIAGQSAGGASVGALMLSPLSAGLFNRVILQSGAPYHPLAGEDPNKSILKANEFAKYVGCAKGNHTLMSHPNVVINCLRDINGRKLAQSVNQWENNSIATFYPIHNDDFMPENPVYTLRHKNFTGFSMLIGNVRDEGSLFSLYKLYGSLPLDNENFNLTREEAYGFIKTLFQDAPRPFPSITASFYLSQADSNNPSDLRRVIYESFGDFFGTCPVVSFATTFAQNGGEAYYYVLTQRPDFSPWPEWIGVAHCDDIPFVFGAPFLEGFNSTQGDRELSMNIMTTWATFVKTGKAEKQKGLTWPRYTPEEPLFMELNYQYAAIGKGPHIRGCAFWKPIFDVTNRR